jgi:hypothetical protein
MTDKLFQLAGTTILPTAFLVATGTIVNTIPSISNADETLSV